MIAANNPLSNLLTICKAVLLFLAQDPHLCWRLQQDLLNNRTISRLWNQIFRLVVHWQTATQYAFYSLFDKTHFDLNIYFQVIFNCICCSTVLIKRQKLMVDKKRQPFFPFHVSGMAISQISWLQLQFFFQTLHFTWEWGAFSPHSTYTAGNLTYPIFPFLHQGGG